MTKLTQLRLFVGDGGHAARGQLVGLAMMRLQSGTLSPLN
jgi:hypothetical protein